MIYGTITIKKQVLVYKESIIHPKNYHRKILNSRIQKLIKNLLPIIENDIEETLPEKLLYELKLLIKETIFDIHIPKNNEDYLKMKTTV